MSLAPRLFQSLRNPVFAKLYFAQTVNLIGDSLTWLGLALLAFELAGERAGLVLSVALTLRVTAFVVLSPLAGAIADRSDRKRLMVITHLARMAIVCLLPFVSQVWQIYAIVLALNLFHAFFTPTYTATIPLVTLQSEYAQAIALSSATNQLLSVLGPGLAGAMAAFVGTRQVFFLDGLTFFITAVLIVTLPGTLRVTEKAAQARTIRQTLQDIQTGTTCLFLDRPIRYALMMQWVAAIAGALILVNTVGYVQGTLNLGKVEYGWTMAAFGIGATLVSFGLGSFNVQAKRHWLVSGGAVLITLAVLPANFVNLNGLLLLWLLVGAGQTLVNLPTQTLIADRVAVEVQGRVYGAHFAWSHFWWAISYPLAGGLGSHFPDRAFLYGSFIGFVLLAAINSFLKFPQRADLQHGLWHEHEHRHDKYHHHDSPDASTIAQPHKHLHFHARTAE